MLGFVSILAVYLTLSKKPELKSLEYEESEYRSDVNFGSSCNGQIPKSNFTLFDQIDCFPACPNQDVESCGLNGCIQYDAESPTIDACQCAQDVWFPTGDINDPTDWPMRNPCSTKMPNWLVVLLPVLFVILVCIIIILCMKKKGKCLSRNEQDSDDQRSEMSEISVINFDELKVRNVTFEDVSKNKNSTIFVHAAPKQIFSQIPSQDMEYIHMSSDRTRSDVEKKTKLVKEKIKKLEIDIKILKTLEDDPQKL